MELLNTKSKSKTNEPKDFYRVVISNTAKEALEQIVKLANEGFEAGEVTKSDIVNSLLINSPKYFTEAEIKSLRSQHFNETKALEKLQKAVAEGKPLPETLKVFLRCQNGLDESPKKRSSSQNSSKKESSLPLATNQDDAA